MNQGFFRKRPVVIEAVQYLLQDEEAVAKWCGGKVVFVIPDVIADPVWQIQIPTLEGTMRASIGDWIIKGVHAEFYPCKPDIFEQTYEAVTT